MHKLKAACPLKFSADGDTIKNQRYGSDTILNIELLQAEASPSLNYPTVEDFVGNTPLVRLQRLKTNPSNVILAKLEGNNPAGSVKDR